MIIVNILFEKKKEIIWRILLSSIKSGLDVTFLIINKYIFIVLR